MIIAEKLPTIPATRIKLRWLNAEDVPALFTIFSDVEVIRYWSHPAYPNIEQAEKLLEDIRGYFERRELFQWGVALLENDEVIGTSTLSAIDAANRRAELGFALGSAHWGKGYMTEALTALLNFAFGELKLHRIEADVDPRNDGSMRMVERLGFQQEGYLRERWIVNGEVQDSIIYGLLRREWSSG